VFGEKERESGGSDFRRRMMMFKSKDLGMEGTRRGRESARKIFERGARSRQRNVKLHREGRV
jgi:hypothetical protein